MYSSVGKRVFQTHPLRRFESDRGRVDDIGREAMVDDKQRKKLQERVRRDKTASAVAKDFGWEDAAKRAQTSADRAVKELTEEDP